MNKRINSHLFMYVLMLLFVSILLVSVTSASYKTLINKFSTSKIEPLICSFDVEEISSTSFANFNYWSQSLDDASKYAMNSPSNISFSSRNYIDNNDDIQISNIELDSVFRISAPEELFDNIAFQIVEKNQDGSLTSLIPQLVLNNLKNYDNQEGFYREETTYGEIGNFANRKIKISKSGTLINNIGKLTFIIQEQMNDTQYVYLANITLTISEEDIAEKFIFKRGMLQADQSIIDVSAPALYCKYLPTRQLVYTLDITTPSMHFAKDTKVEKNYAFYYTIINAYSQDNNNAERFNKIYDENDTDITELSFIANNIKCYSDITLTKLIGNKDIEIIKDIKNNSYQYKYIYGDSSLETEIISYDDKTIGKVKDRNIYFEIDDNLNDLTYNHQNNSLNFAIGESLGKIHKVSAYVIFVQTSNGGN